MKNVCDCGGTLEVVEDYETVYKCQNCGNYYSVKSNDRLED
jgi:hypothetical protein